VSTETDFDGVRYDTFNDGPGRCSCGRAADYDGRRCCMCAPLTADERRPAPAPDARELAAHDAHVAAIGGRCSHGGHDWEGTCSDIDDALAAPGAMPGLPGGMGERHADYCVPLQWLPVLRSVLLYPAAGPHLDPLQRMRGLVAALPVRSRACARYNPTPRDRSK
jgi:hypothetical protein